MHFLGYILVPILGKLGIYDQGCVKLPPNEYFFEKNWEFAKCLDFCNFCPNLIIFDHISTIQFTCMYKFGGKISVLMTIFLYFGGIRPELEIVRSGKLIQYLKESCKALQNSRKHVRQGTIKSYQLEQPKNLSIRPKLFPQTPLGRDGEFTTYPKIGRLNAYIICHWHKCIIRWQSSFAGKSVMQIWKLASQSMIELDVAVNIHIVKSRI